MSYLLFLLLISVQTFNACPTCIGRIEKNAPPFFSAEYDEHYSSYTQASHESLTETTDTHEEEEL